MKPIRDLKKGQKIIAGVVLTCEKGFSSTNPVFYGEKKMSFLFHFSYLP